MEHPILADLLLTVFAYDLFPICFALLRKKPIKARSYRLLCYAYAIIVWLGFRVLSNLAGSASSGYAPAVLWTGIGIAIGSSILSEKTSKTSQSTETDIPPETNQEMNTPDSNNEETSLPAPVPEKDTPNKDRPCFEAKTQTQPRKGAPIWIVIVLILTIGILLGILLSKPLYHSEKSDFTASDIPKSSATPTPQPTSVPTPSPQPNKSTSGALFVVPRDERLAPFTIEAPVAYDCFVRLHNNSDPKNDVGVYVRAGDTVTIDVPLGVYKLYYATGLDWKGAGAQNNMVFGPDTQWSTSPKSFVFSQDGEYYNGHSITLYSVFNGNLSTELIKESDLPF